MIDKLVIVMLITQFVNHSLLGYSDGLNEQVINWVCYYSLGFEHQTFGTM